jgi:hypothetical protein
MGDTHRYQQRQVLAGSAYLQLRLKELIYGDDVIYPLKAKIDYPQYYGHLDSYLGFCVLNTIIQMPLFIIKAIYYYSDPNIEYGTVFIFSIFIVLMFTVNMFIMWYILYLKWTDTNDRSGKYLDLICRCQQLFLATMLTFYSLKLVSQLFRQDRCMKLTNDNFYKYNFMCNYLDTGVPFRSTALLLFAPYSAQAMFKGINFRLYVYAWLYITSIIISIGLSMTLAQSIPLYFTLSLFIFVFFHNDLVLINNEILMEQYWTDMSRRSEVVEWQTDDLKVTSMLNDGCLDVEAQRGYANERVSGGDVELRSINTSSEVNDSALLNLANQIDVERKWTFLENVEMYKDNYIELSSLCRTSNRPQPLRLQRQDRQLKLSGDLDEANERSVLLWMDELCS